jgi:GT2 family glycosyltransferase
MNEPTGLPNGPLVGLLLLNWNDHLNVVACAQSLLNNTYRAARLYVIDNGSDPDSIRYVQTHLPSAILIQNGRNLGFCGGFNVGIARALEDNVDIICVMNSDLRVGADFVRTLADAFRDSGVAAAAPTELDYYAPDRVLFAGGRLNPVLNQRDGYGEENSEGPQRSRDTEMLCGAAMVFRATTLRVLGSFDERLFFGGEDHEMTLRILKAGMRIRYVPSAKVWHKGGLTGGGGGTPLMAFFGIRNYLLVARWYGSPIQMAAALGMVVGVRIPRILFRAVISKDIRYLRGLNWFLLWFLDPNLVPPDFRIAQALAGPGQRGSM